MIFLFLISRKAFICLKVTHKYILIDWVGKFSNLRMCIRGFMQMRACRYSYAVRQSGGIESLLLGELLQKRARLPPYVQPVCPLRDAGFTSAECLCLYFVWLLPQELFGNKEIQLSRSILSLPHSPAQLTMTPLCVSKNENDILISKTKRLSPTEGKLSLRPPVVIPTIKLSTSSKWLHFLAQFIFNYFFFKVMSLLPFS